MKKTILLLILTFIAINIILIYLYDQHFNKSNPFDYLNSSPTLMSAQREIDNATLTAHRQTAITEVVRRIEPAVVSVNIIRTNLINVRHPVFWNIYHTLRQDVQSIGSGVLFTDDGYIITNAHVVSGATQITVVMTDNTHHDATIVGIDHPSDIAILKINAKNLPFARLGSSADLMTGEWSIAIGNPFGYLMADAQPSVSVGVISALNRSIKESADGRIHRGMIQTDAAINPGNSGGPLVNIHGEVIGINSFIFTTTQTNIGIGFAIPIDKVKQIAQELIAYGRVREPYLGFTIDPLTRNIALQLGLLTLEGVVISKVDPDSPTEKAGLQRGDVIIKINDTPIKNLSDVQHTLYGLSPADEVVLVVIRDRREHSFTLIAGDLR